MRSPKFMSLLLIIGALWASTSADTLYVNVTAGTGGLGTKAAPFKFVDSAFAHINANTTTVVKVAAGTYPINKTINIPSGTTLTGANKSSTILTGIPGKVMFTASGASNITIENVTLDGVNKKAQQAMGLVSSKNVHLANLIVQYFNWGGITITGASSNYLIENCYFKNNGNGNNGGDRSNLTMSGLQNSVIHDVTILEEGVNGAGGKGIGMNYSSNIKMYNLSITVPKKGLWNNQKAPAICIEFWCPDSMVIKGVEIYNSYFNNTISIVNVRPANPDSSTVHLHNCVFKPLGYAIEIHGDNVTVDHNYFEGGPYPFANWGPTASKKCLVHHNVFKNIGQYLTYGRFSGFAFYNNTVDCPYYSQPLFRDSTDTHPQIKNNIFVNHEPAKGVNKLGLIASAGIDHNLFFNTKSLGTSVLTSNPLLVGGGVTPFPAYCISQSSPAWDAGVVIPGVTNGFKGKAPDMGAWEIGTPYWTVGTVGTAGLPSTPVSVVAPIWQLPVLTPVTQKPAQPYIYDLSGRRMDVEKHMTGGTTSIVTVVNGRSLKITDIR